MPRIEVDVNRCKACYLCVNACPKKCLGKSTVISKKGYFPAEMQRPQDCIGCKMCLKVGCPAIMIKEKKAHIDLNQCVGCTVCVQVCPQKAIAREGN